MFRGDLDIRSDREILKRDVGFLIKNKVSPIPSTSVRIPMLSIRHDLHVNLDLYANQVSQKIARVMDFSLPHEVMDTNAREWQPSDERQTQQLIRRMCESIAGNVLRAGSPQEEMYAFMGFLHRPLIRNAKNREYVLADIAYGITTHLRDGGRYYNQDGTNSFDQRKGNYSRTTHIFFRSMPK